MTATDTSNRAAERFLETRKTPQTMTFGAVPHSYDGSSYYRIWLPMKHLEPNTRHVTGVRDPAAPNVMRVDEAAQFHALMFQRPAGKTGAQMLEQYVGQTKLIYETDDNMLEVDPSGLPHLYDETVRDSVRRCVRLCDMVTTTNEHLADVFRPYCDNVVILPNYVKAGMLDLVRPRRQRLTVGWAGGTSHLIDMVDIQDVLYRLLADHSGIDLHCIGFDFTPLLKDQRGRCRRTNWNPDVGHYYKNIDFDIAIAPSADVPFNRSKTPIRALEMAALGIPIVAQNRLPYTGFIIDGKTGFLVDTPAQWRDRLEELIHDETLREQLGQNARAQAAELTIEKNWWRWEAAYEKAANS
jgi:glycosyltransferase involved in cell wall biosynthesis